jgi:hypothetical protein
VCCRSEIASVSSARFRRVTPASVASIDRTGLRGQPKTAACHASQLISPSRPRCPRTCPLFERPRPCRSTTGRPLPPVQRSGTHQATRFESRPRPSHLRHLELVSGQGRLERAKVWLKDRQVARRGTQAPSSATWTRIRVGAPVQGATLVVERMTSGGNESCCLGI